MKLLIIMLLVITGCNKPNNPFPNKLHPNDFIGRWSVKKDTVETIIWDIRSKDSLTFIFPGERSLNCAYWMEVSDSQKYLLIYPNDSLDIVKYKIYKSQKDELLLQQVSYWHFHEDANIWKEWSMPEKYSVKFRFKLRNLK